MAASVKPSVVCAPPRPHGECFSAKFHHDMSMLAAGYADGSVLVYDPNAVEMDAGLAAKLAAMTGFVEVTVGVFWVLIFFLCC